MELALTLGDSPKPLSSVENNPTNLQNKDSTNFCISLGEPVFNSQERRDSSDPPLQLNLLPSTPILPPHSSSHLPIPWLSHALCMERVPSDRPARLLDVNRLPMASAAEDGDDVGTAVSSPNSAASSFQMDFGMRNSNADASRNRREHEGEGGERASDDDENGSTRKKLRLSKEQSAFLEESFKEHATLNPKQKLALAKQLNLRPRQVEVWFQNRRARTKLKQTEVDCEYLKRCCETLTEENRRLQKELQELRALKTSQPFYMQLPATTLTMCPSCERVATTSTGHTPSAAANQTTSANNNGGSESPAALTLNKPRMLPFLANGQAHVQQAQAH